MSERFTKDWSAEIRIERSDDPSPDAGLWTITAMDRQTYQTIARIVTDDPELGVKSILASVRHHRNAWNLRKSNMLAEEKERRARSPRMDDRTELGEDTDHHEVRL